MNTQCKQLFQVGIYDSIDIYVTYLIDFDHPKCKEAIKDMASYWIDVTDMPFVENLEYWLKLATHTAHNLYQWEGYGGIQSINRLAERITKSDGFCPLDGSFGISIVDYCFEEYETEDFEIQTLDICTCVACECTDANACTPACRWVKLNRQDGIGLCSKCHEKTELWLDALKKIKGENT